MPVSLPGFNTCNEFFDLFLPLKKAQQNDFSHPQPVTLDESCFSSNEPPEKIVPFTEDCRRALQHMLCQYAVFKQKQLILRSLLQGLPALPVELINAAYTLWHAITHKENIDIAVLNTLGLATNHLLAEGNEISQLAQFVRETIISWVGESFIYQFLNIDENNPDGALFTALAIMAITLKYWMSTPLIPHRRLLQLPPYLANLVLRISNYWGQIGMMSQHAAAHCQLPAARAGKDYVCIEENIGSHKPKGLVLLDHDAWTCTEASWAGDYGWKPLPTCGFDLSAATLKQVREEGAVGSRYPFTPNSDKFFSRQEADIELQPVAAASSTKSSASALLLPIAATTIGWRGAGKAALGTSIAALMGYGWYLFSQPNRPEIAQEQADITGILQDNERIFLEKWSAHQSPPTPEKYAPLPPATPFNQSQRDQLWQIGNECEEDDTPSLFLPLSGPRVKRDVGGVHAGHESTSRQNYWLLREQQAEIGSAEKSLFALLKAGPQPGGNYSLAVPRESFPLADAWFTRMDQLRFEDFSAAFQTRLLTAAKNVAKNLKILPPDNRLPIAVWLHLGKYYEHFYKNILQNWTKTLLRLDAAQSEEYSFAAKNVDLLTKKLNSDWNNSAINPSSLEKLAKQSATLNNLHNQLKIFSAHEKERIATALKNQTRGVSRDIPVEEFSWGKQRLAYLEYIDLAKFTSEYSDVIRRFVESAIVNWGKGTGLIDVVDFYTGLSILTINRVYAGVVNKDIQKIYNFAELDEQLTRIIRENISKFWVKEDQVRYFRNYNPIAFKLVPLWWEMKAQLESEQTWKTTITPGLAEQPMNTTLAPVDWDRVREGAEAAGELPVERFNAQEYVQQILKAKLDEMIKKMIDLVERDILNPDQFIEKWIASTLELYGKAREYSSASIFKVDYPRHPDEEIKSLDGFGGRNNPPRFYSLQEIIRGVHREHDNKFKSKSRIFWPDDFSTQLRERLETGISGDIDRQIDSLFTQQNKNLHDIFRMMIRRSALNYLARKNSVASEDFYHDVFTKAVSMFLKGKNDAQLVLWHRKIVSGLVFIPAEKVVTGRLKELTIGVFLSVWNNDYYEVPWPGFTQTFLAEKEDVKRVHKLIIESKSDFQEFMSRHRTIQVSRNLARADNEFGYHHTISMHDTTNYHAPFTFKAISAAKLTDQMIELYRQDIQDLYDTAIFSDAELTRSIVFERLNALGFVVGIFLMGGTLAFGGPAWAWVLASVTAMLFLDVVPNAVLYSQADSDEERELYVDAMVMAVAFEVAGSMATDVVAPMLKTAVKRVAKLSSNAFRSALPQWYDFAKTKLENTLTKTGVRLLKKPAEETSTLSPSAKQDLDDLVKKFDSPQAGEGLQPVGGRFRASSDWGRGPGDDFLERHELLYDISLQLNLLKFNTKYRVTTEWYNTKHYFIRNFYTVVGERESDRVVLEVINHGKDYSYVFFPEDEWLRNTINEAKSKNVLMTYYDFDLPSDITIERYALAKSSSSIVPQHYPKNGRHIYVPAEWKEKMSLFKFKYDEMQEMLEKLTTEEADTLAKKIRMEIEANPALQSELNKDPRLPSPPILDSADEATNKAMLRCHYICAIGSDIEKFYPLPKWLPLMDTTKEFKARWAQSVDEYIKKAKHVKLVKENFVALKESGGAGIVTAEQLIKIEREFHKLYSVSENLAALLAKAKNDPLIKETILVTLARFVNSTEPRILGEAYQRLNTLAERLYQLAHYHVIEQQLSRVVPMTSISAAKTLQAFVIAQDPFARIMLMLPKVAEHADITGLLIHEMSHLAVNSEDFRYLNQEIRGYLKLPEHHVEFGKYALEKNSPYTVLGQSQQFYEDRQPSEFKALTEFDRALAQARVRRHPMLGAYVKMNNADSLVVLVNALMEQFDFKHSGQTMKGGIDDKTWTISLASPSKNTHKRSVKVEDDFYYRQFREDVLVTLFYQALTITIADILPDEKRVF